METRANYVAVGIFTVLLVFGIFAMIYWSYGVGSAGDTSLLRIRIPGSAAGLGRGSSVLFNGIKVGDVRRVYIDVNNPTVAIADAEIDKLTPITELTKADIGLAGLTGQASIELTGGDPTEPNLLAQAELTGEIAEITANPSAVTNLLQTAQDIFTRADAVLNTLEGFVTDVRGPLTQTVNNANTFSQALSRNAEGVDKFLANFETLSETLGNVSGRLDSTLASAEELLDSVDREKVDSIVTNFQTFTDRLQSASADLDGIMDNVDGAAASVRGLSENANGLLAKTDGILDDVKAGVQSAVGSFDRLALNASGTLAKVDGVLEEGRSGIDEAVGAFSKVTKDASGSLARVDNLIDSVDSAKLNDALANIDSASADARKAATDVAAFTDRIGNRSDDIEQIIANARGIAEKLNQASTRVDGVLAKVDTLLGSDKTEGVFVEATETLKAFRQVADTLNARMGTITDGLARFTGQGLRDAEALIRDSRRSIDRIEQAITALERNPQRIITGGEGTVRQYDGRVRR